ncbi:Ribosome biogenesis protein BMS1/TSR1 C-terminal domain-containing protein [Entamoeba marina]
MEHKAGALSQKNKPFKRKGGSKRASKVKGKKQSEKTSFRPIMADPKEVRRNQQKQRQQASRAEQLERARKEKMGIGEPRLVGFMGVGGGDVNASLFALSEHWEVQQQHGDITYVKTKFKRLAIWKVSDDIWSRMNVGKVADIMVITVGGEPTADEEEKLDFLVAQGLGDIVLLGEKGKFKKGRWSGCRVYDATKEGGLIVRNLCDSAVKKKIDGSGYLVVDKEEITVNGLKVYGYVRRSDFSRLQNVHVIGEGDYPVKQLSSEVDPYGVGTQNINAFQIMEEEESHEESNDMDNGMSEEEIEHEHKPSAFNITKNVPVGSGSYTAAWIVGDEDNEVNEIIEEVYDDDDDEELMDTNNAMSEKYNKYSVFPDKYRVGLNECAKDTFKGYRGLRSLRQTEWECDDDLPETYSSLIQFDNFKKMTEYYGEVDDGIEQGSYISLVLGGLTGGLVGKVVSSLRQFEDNPSIVHVLFTVENDALPLASEATYIIQIGDRRYKREVIFSENNMLGGKWKTIKYAAPGSSIIGSFYGFVCYPPAPTLLFQVIDGREELVATGSLDILLTGRPIKIGKRKVTVKGLFTQPSDAKWFKPIELMTKQGICGSILCSLGEKGLVKCTFEQQLKANDVVTLALYRRVFPPPPTTLN